MAVQPEFRSGTGVIHDLAIRSTVNSNVTDFKQLVTEISYYESIDSPATSMYLDIMDAIAFRNTLPLVGGETVQYSISDSTQNANRIRGNMTLYKLSNRVRAKQGVDSYELNLTTNTLLQDQSTVISQGLQTTNISDMVRQVFSTHIAPLTNKPLVTVEDTEGTFTTVLPRVSPLTAMRYLADEAKSANDRSTSNFFFFENAKGFHFASLQYLMRQPPKATFYNLEDRIPGDDRFDRSRVVAIEQSVGFDLLSGVTNGQLGVQVLSLDPVAKRFRTSQYLYNRDFGQVEHITAHPRIAPSVAQRLGSSITREKFIVSNSYQGTIPYITNNDGSTQNTFRRRQDFLARETYLNSELLSSVTKVMIHGNSNIAVGDTIKIVMPKVGESSSRDKQTDSFVSGKYLVTAVSHRLTAGGLEYSTLLECVADAYSTPIA
jgi:hypothetical protein